MPASTMPALARRFGLDTAFVPLQHERADLRVRYFVFDHEMGVSGHATIAAVTVALVTKILDQNPVRIETSSGIFEASWTRTRTTIELLWIRTLPFLLLRPPDDAARVLGI